MKHLSFAILAAALGAFPAAAATGNPFADVVPYAGRKRLDRSLVTRTDNPDGTIDFDFRRAFAAGADIKPNNICDSYPLGRNLQNYLLTESQRALK